MGGRKPGGRGTSWGLLDSLRPSAPPSLRVPWKAGLFDLLHPWAFGWIRPVQAPWKGSAGRRGMRLECYCPTTCVVAGSGHSSCSCLFLEQELFQSFMNTLSSPSPFRSRVGQLLAEANLKMLHHGLALPLPVLVNFVCHLDWAKRCPRSWVCL